MQKRSVLKLWGFGRINHRENNELHKAKVRMSRMKIGYILIDPLIKCGYCEYRF
jgi:hypothetical protein